MRYQMEKDDHKSRGAEVKNSVNDAVRGTKIRTKVKDNVICDVNCGSYPFLGYGM